MQPPRLIAPCLLALVLGTACGTSSDHSSDGSTATTTDIASYQQFVTRVQDSATAYRTTITAPATTLADCRRIHDAYDAEVRPWVSRMVQMSGGMDRYVTGHGGANVADFACASATMMNELDHHRSVACTLADLGADQTEAGRHVGAMLSYGGHMWDRCSQMMHGTGTGNSGWGPMMSGCEGWDGCCSGMMHDCCGGMMHGGCCDG